MAFYHKLRHREHGYVYDETHRVELMYVTSPYIEKLETTRLSLDRHFLYSSVILFNL